MILVRYILKEHLGPFFGSLFVITFLFVIDFLVQLMNSVFNKGLPFQIIFEIFILNLAWILALSIPMACLVSTLMAFGRWSSDHEITAIKAAGIPPFRMMRPILLVSTLIAIFLVVFNNWILPEANHRSAALMSDISRKKPHAFIDAGRLLTQFPGVQIWIDDINQENGVLYGIQIFQFEKKQAPRLILADSATIEYKDMGSTLLLHLYDGENHIPENDDPMKYFRIRFRNQDLYVSTPDAKLKRHERKHRSDREMPIEDMLEVTYSAAARQEKLIADNATSVWRHLDMINMLILPEKERIKRVKDSIAAIVKIDSLTDKKDSLQSIKDSLTQIAALSKKKAKEKALKAQENLKNSQNKSKHLSKVEGAVYWRNALRLVNSQERNQLKRIERIYSRINREEKRISQYWVEIHKKFSIPVACIVFVLLGAPLGIMARKGGIGTGVVYSLFFFVIYWVFLTGGENLADKLYISPEVAMWSSNVLIFFVGVFTTWKMTRDNYSGNSKISRFWRWIGIPRLINKIIAKHNSKTGGQN